MFSSVSVEINIQSFHKVSSCNGDADLLPQAVKTNVNLPALLVSVNYFFQCNLITLLMYLSLDYVMQNLVSPSVVFLMCTVFKTNTFIASAIIED